MSPDLKAALEAITPGPWEDLGGTVRAVDGPKVAGVLRVADARLIKTSPRLLVALIETTELLETIFEVMGSAPDGGDDLVDNARRAIEEATATGRWVGH